jgi:hypothetical protein
MGEWRYSSTLLDLGRFNPGERVTGTHLKVARPTEATWTLWRKENLSFLLGIYPRPFIP